MSESLQQMKHQECQFLEQLLDPQTIESYHVPVTIKADLRKYQQVCVSECEPPISSLLMTLFNTEVGC
jgi:hypothetical protein